MTDVIRVVLADDHPIYRDGLARSLGDAPDIRIVGVARDGEEAALIVMQTRPDVVLLDVSMPKGGGIAALTLIMQMDAPPRVAMLTASEEDGDLLQSVKLGALGYILKGVGAEELVEVVRELRAGRTYVSPGLAGQLLVAMRRRNVAAAEPNPLDELSRREEDILKLVAQGKSNREVGDVLDLQEKTVKHYMTSILQKLQVRNRVEAALLARQHLRA